MKALRIHEFGRLESLAWVDVPTPSAAPGEALVRVEAVGLNRADVLQCLGKYPAPPGFPQDIPGLEYAGVVEKVGPQVTTLAPGVRVMGLVGGGAFAEFLKVPEAETIPVPSWLSPREAAALPEAFLTAYDALVLQANVQVGEGVLIHAVASGVGVAAAQLARALGARVIGTSRTPEKLEKLHRFGLEHSVTCGSPPAFAQDVQRLTQGRGVDVALDLIGGPYLTQTTECMAERGRIVLLGLLGGARAELPLGLLLSKRLTLRGSTLRSRSSHEKSFLAREFQKTLLPLFEKGPLQPVIDETLPMTEIHAALSKLGQNRSVGKIVLQWRAP